MTRKTDRVCPECGEKVGAGIVRHPRCFQEALEKRLGPVPKAKLVPGRMYLLNGGTEVRQVEVKRDPRAPKICESCGGVINPITGECRCSD